MEALENLEVLESLEALEHLKQKVGRSTKQQVTSGEKGSLSKR